MCTLQVLLLRELLAEEGEDLAPAVHALLGPVERPVPVEKAVARSVVAMEFVILAVLFQLGFVLIHLLGTRRAVVIAEEAKQRAGEILGHLDRRDRRLGIELLLAHHHAAAPQFDTGVDIFLLARIDEGMPATGAGAEKPDLPVVISLAAHPLHRGLGIADHLRVGNAALRAHIGGDVVRIALTRTLIEIGADREIAVMREASRRLDVELAPARKMVHEHHAGEGALALGLCRISGDRCPLVPVEGHVLASHASIEWHRSSLVGRGRRAPYPQWWLGSAILAIAGPTHQRVRVLSFS